jgi:hypothetical protein
VTASLQPPNSRLREFKREFCGFGANSANLGYIHRANSTACSQIPEATVSGIFWVRYGNFWTEYGNFPARLILGDWVLHLGGKINSELLMAMVTRLNEGVQIQ